MVLLLVALTAAGTTSSVARYQDGIRTRKGCAGRVPGRTEACLANPSAEPSKVSLRSLGCGQCSSGRSSARNCSSLDVERLRLRSGKPDVGPRPTGARAEDRDDSGCENLGVPDSRRRRPKPSSQTTSGSTRSRKRLVCDTIRASELLPGQGVRTTPCGQRCTNPTRHAALSRVQPRGGREV
jgi:hypothetical protein